MTKKNKSNNKNTDSLKNYEVNTFGTYCFILAGIYYLNKNKKEKCKKKKPVKPKIVVDQSSITNNLTIPFDVYFPDKINQNSVDEYLVFVASEEDIPWLEEYSQIEGLKSQISKSKILMEKDYIGYIVIN